MNLRFVEAFYWVSTLKSVSRAAEKLFITQSAMSARIAALEDELGVLLLDRRNRRVTLTVAGMRFVSHAKRLLEMQREVKAEMGSGRAAAAHLRIGAIESVLHSWLILWLETLRRDNQELEIELSVETTPVLIDQVQRGGQDIVFTALPVNGEGLRTKVLPPMEMCFVGDATRFRKRAYTLVELAQGELLSFQRGSQPHLALLDALHACNMEHKRVHAISSISAMAQLVAGGFGVASLPRAAASSLVKSHGLRLLKCDVTLPPLPIHATYRSDPTSTLVEDALRSALPFA
jgi:DNA-binding transcriptional LysR family regulator